ncbi:ribonuclease H2 subunit C [Hemiscyllium ocellatum]|uniref:ribonuclease H2 subunit C n=1 Tax=Hemiscyllium ocellatum TaxID=170820 RepID=UPI00296775DA|nr:ribonuclease H2 subunit C [Hemiscyllium ocellatum]
MAVSSVITVDLNSLKDPARDRVHLLPARVESDGSASVGQYFSPAIRHRDGALQVSFRGRPLLGRDLPLPPGYVGLVLKEDHRPCLEEEDRTVSVTSAFCSLTYWNLESRPTEDDSVAMAMGWTQIAKALHAPVEDQ